MVVSTRNTTCDIHTYNISVLKDVGAFPKLAVKKATFRFVRCLLFSVKGTQSTRLLIVKPVLLLPDV